MICFALAKSGINADIQRELFDAQGNLIRERAQGAFPLLVTHVLPPGIRGIVVAGLLAALMSALAGVFNASSSLFTMDFYSKLKPKATQAELVKVGRIATVVMVLIGLLWIPVIEGGRGLYDYLQGIQAYLAPPIFVVFFFGIFMKRLNGTGCMATLLTGFAMGLFRLAVDTPVKLGGAPYTEGSFLWIVNNIFFQYYSLLITLVCIIVFILVSYATRQPDYAKISGLTFSTLSDEDRKATRATWSTKDVVLSILLVALIIAIYAYFTG
jgi:SSS family solute:Na+ symporter